MHYLRLDVWYGLWSVGVIGPYFSAYFNGDTQFFVATLHAIDVNNVWFQQDCAIYHKSHVTINLLLQTYDGCLIRRNSNVHWPPLELFLIKPIETDIPNLWKLSATALNIKKIKTFASRRPCIVSSCKTHCIKANTNNTGNNISLTKLACI